MSPNQVQSIKARLLNEARRREDDFQVILVRYACERFLYRLGVSEYRRRLALKGGCLLTLWMDEPYRATRDLDLHATGANDAAGIRAAMERSVPSTVPKTRCSSTPRLSASRRSTRTRSIRGNERG